jgi:GxxExxY protein
MEQAPDGALSGRVIALAMDVHKQLGPGLLESVYEECLSFELRQHDVPFARQVPLGVIYKGVKLECGYRMDIVVDDQLLIEVKSLERLLPIHDAQMLTYLKLSGIRVGLLMNFNSLLLKDGLRRLVL